VLRRYASLADPSDDEAAPCPYCLLARHAVLLDGPRKPAGPMRWLLEYRNPADCRLSVHWRRSPPSCLACVIDEPVTLASRSSIPGLSNRAIAAQMRRHHRSWRKRPSFIFIFRGPGHVGDV